MSDLNSISFTGRLGNDAECKYTQSGTPIWTASVGNGYGFGDHAGTNWLRVQVFGKRAESLAKLDLRKGAAVGVTGELRVRQYDKSDGSKGTSVEVVAQDVALLGGKPEGAQRTDRPTAKQPQRESVNAQMDSDFASDDIPW